MQNFIQINMNYFVLHVRFVQILVNLLQDVLDYSTFQSLTKRIWFIIFYYDY